MPKATKEVAPGTAAIQFDTRPSKRKLQEWRQGYLFLLPAVVILGIFIGIAAIFVVYLSFHKVNLFTDSYTFVGLENYLRLFTDETARKALTNTLSFMRVGAYAITHVGLMLVVHMLADLAGGVGGPVGILILVLGNIFVMGFEGLLVGIQVLRLEFYELFGRFYDDGGVPFVPKKIDYAARING